jgi:hypothetical protein
MMFQGGEVAVMRGSCFVKEERLLRMLLLCEGEDAAVMRRKSMLV